MPVSSVASRYQTTRMNHLVCDNAVQAELQQSDSVFDAVIFAASCFALAPSLSWEVFGGRGVTQGAMGRAVEIFSRTLAIKASWIAETAAATRKFSEAPAVCGRTLQMVLRFVCFLLADLGFCAHIRARLPGLCQYCHCCISLSRRMRLKTFV